MGKDDTLLNALLGALVTVVLSFTGFSPILGGAAAGYLQQNGPGDGARVGALSGLVASLPVLLVFILFAEFGDKTQLLTINLAATFPDAPVAVFVGVVAALGLRTGVDAVIGQQFERAVPTAGIELFAAAVFLGFGLVVFDLLPGAVLVAILVVGLLAAGWWTVRRYLDEAE